MEQPTFLPVETLDEVDDKIREIQARPEVRRVQWFFLAGHVERVEDWKTTHIRPKFTPPKEFVREYQDEEKYEVYVPPSFSQRAQGAARTGQEVARPTDADQRD